MATHQMRCWVEHLSLRVKTKPTHTQAQYASLEKKGSAQVHAKGQGLYAAQ